MRLNTKTGDINLTIKLDLRDLWVGVYWHFSKSIESAYRSLDIYVCIVPAIPIHLRFELGWR